jgi:outer membrane protein assembly factor BamB
MMRATLLAFARIAAFASLSGPLPDPPPLLWSTQVGSLTAAINAELAVVDLPTSPPSTRLLVSTGASVAALDATTGKVLWNSTEGIPVYSDAGSGPQGYATPIYEPGANLVLAVLATKYGSVVAIEATTGKLRWAFNSSITRTSTISRMQEHQSSSKSLHSGLR